MNFRRHLKETATLVASAVLCALLANAVASRDRKLKVVPEPIPTARQVERTPLAAETPLPEPPSKATPAPLATAVPATTRTPRPEPTKTGPGTASSSAPASPAGLLKRYPPHPDRPYVEVHHDTVAPLHTAGALFLDARRTKDYQEGHIAGARPYSIWESDVDEKVKAFLDEGPNPDLPVVIYCSGGDCHDSHILAEKLFGVNFNNVFVYKDGFPDWQKRGGPVRTGPNP